MTDSTRKWLGGLISSGASGIAGALGSVSIDSMTGAGWSWERCLLWAGLSIVIHVAGYLQKSPLPEA